MDEFIKNVLRDDSYLEKMIEADLAAVTAEQERLSLSSSEAHAIFRSSLKKTPHPMFFNEERQIGEGTYGKVYSVRCPKTCKRFALKRVQLEPDYGIPFTTIREINMLKKFRHANVISLIEIYPEKSSLSLVFDYAEYDLAGLSEYVFHEKQFCSIAYQLFSALAYMHSFGIIHRDIKSSNILLTTHGVLKIADFGLARYKTEVMTNRVCTLWYRAPELLLGAVDYNTSVDIWSAGCVLVEIVTKHVLFKAEDEITQIRKILSIFGPPTGKYPWSDILRIDKYQKNSTDCSDFLGYLCEHFKEDLFYIIVGCLQIDPEKRVNAAYIIKHPALVSFECVFYPMNINDIHEFTSKKNS